MITMILIYKERLPQMILAPNCLIVFVQTSLGMMIKVVAYINQYQKHVIYIKTL